MQNGVHLTKRMILEYDKKTSHDFSSEIGTITCSIIKLGNIQMLSLNEIPKLMTSNADHWEIQN